MIRNDRELSSNSVFTMIELHLISELCTLQVRPQN